MKIRDWVLVGALGALALLYVVFFTEWLRPAPIEIASQVRFSVQPPRFGRAVPRKVTLPRGTFTGTQTGMTQVAWFGKTGEVIRVGETNLVIQDMMRTGGTGQLVRLGPKGVAIPAKPLAPNPRVKPGEEVERVGLPETGKIDQAPGGVANVTFSLDAWYQLTRIRVEDLPVDGTPPNVVWHLVGKSLPLNSLLYGRAPEGMKPLVQGANPEPLKPEVPYRLIVEAGRRRGTNGFRTTELRPADQP